MRIVIVEWDDAYSSGGWLNPNDDLSISKCITVGLLLSEDDVRVVVAQNASLTSGSVGDILAIPRGCIKRIRKLRIK